MTKKKLKCSYMYLLLKCDDIMTYHNWKENKAKYKNPLIAYSHPVSENNPSWITFDFKTVKDYQPTKLVQRTGLWENICFWEMLLLKRQLGIEQLGEKILKDNQNLVISHTSETEGTWLPYRIKFEKKLPKSLNTGQTVNRRKNTIYLCCLSPYWDSFNNKYVLQILIELLLHTRHGWKALGIWQWSKQSPTPYELSTIRKNNFTNLNFWHEGGKNRTFLEPMHTWFKSFKMSKVTF